MNRLAKEAWEAQNLHPAASRSSASRGRAVDELPDDWRTRFERDRDRIIHCSAFRRLMYKTQVFVNHVGDNQRTRMTHSLEVLQVSRSLASALHLNEPLCEAIALSHDLGHPPYGHSGEETLDISGRSFPCQVFAKEGTKQWISALFPREIKIEHEGRPFRWLVKVEAP